jgi:hypothetical protein
MATKMHDRAFFRNAILDTIVPDISNAKLPDALDNALEAGIEEDGSLISIKQREHLFFGQQNLSFLGIIISYSFADV